MAWTWHAVDLKTGKRGPQLQMNIRGKVQRILCEATESQGAFLCWDAEKGAPVPEWEYWTEAGRMMAVLVNDEDEPMWGGIFLRVTPDETEWVPVALATLEHYLDRRYSGDISVTGWDQADIAGFKLVQNIIDSDGVPFIIDRVHTGILRDRTYYDHEDKTTFSLLTDLVNLQSGIEFTVDLRWSDSTHTVLQYVFRVGPRIGKSLPNPTRFEHPGCIQRFSMPKDYGRENGANDSMATSSGEGDARPQSAHYVDQAKLDAGWVRYEHRFTPSTSITDTNTLDSYAAGDLEEKRDGLNELTIVADLDTAPVLNSEWWLGDDITVALTAPALPGWRDNDGVLWPGYEKRVRVVGYEIDLDNRTLTPSVREYI